MKNIAQRLQEDNTDMFDRVMALKEKQYQEHADFLKTITLPVDQFKLMVEAQNKFLCELAEKYELKRELMHIEGRSYVGRKTKLYLFYDHKEIGTVTMDYRTEGRSYFLDHTFTPNPNAHVIVGEANARKEMEEAFDYFLPKPKGSAIPNFEHKK